MHKIKKGDLVQITKGKDSGKKGKVIRILPEGKRLTVEGLNLVKKHKRQTRQDQAGGIISLEAPLSVANVMLFCKECNHPVRVGFSILNDKSKVRICKNCKGQL